VGRAVQAAPRLSPQCAARPGPARLFGLGIIATTSLSGLGGGTDVLGIGVRAAAVALALVLNVGLFWLAFRLATAPEIASCGRDRSSPTS